MSKNTDRIRHIIGLVMAFMLAMTLSFLGILLIMNFTFFSESYLVGNLESSNYFQRAHGNIEENIGYRGTPFGIPEDTLDGLITIERVQEDVESYLRNRIHQGDYVLDTAFLTAGIDQRIQELLTSEGIVIGEAQEEAISEFSMLAEREYRNRTEIPFLGTYSSVARAFERYFPFILGGLIFGILLFGGMLLMLFRVKTVLGYFGLSLAGGGLLVGVLPLYLFIANPIERIQIHPESFYHYINQMVSTFILTLLILGALMILFAIPALMYDYHQRNRRRRKKSVIKEYA